MDFPRELNSYQLAECTFLIVEGVALSRAGKGRAITAIDQFDPWVMARIRTGPLTHAERRAWSAWKNSLRGGMKHFLAYDQARSWLLNYPHGVPEIIAETWNGEAIVTELSAYEMTVEGAPEGFVMLPGDALGLVLDGKHGWFEVTEASTAGGDEMTIAFAPYAPPTLFTVGSTAVLYRPKAKFVLDPDSWEETADTKLSPISFTALQVF
ncbi:MAG: hypothetical protein KF810_02945 [Rhizobiaceae bacterium]|nr:hypothetical protein [Rhizobiaceae bacterium]